MISRVNSPQPTPNPTMKLKMINQVLTSIVGAVAIGSCLTVASASAQTSVVAHWTFDTASLMTDGSGNITNIADSTGNHNMSPGVSIGSGGTGYPFTSAAFPGSDSISGSFGQGLMFNGNNFMMFTNLTEIMASSGAPSYTISYWVNVPASVSTGNGNHQLGGATPFESLADWGNAAATTGKSRYVYCFGAGGTTSEISHARYLNGANGTDIYGRTATTSTVNDDNWHMLSWSFDTASGVLKSYFDGVLVDTYTSGSSSFVMADAASVFGTFGVKGDNGYMLPAGYKIDEAWVFTGVLNTNQIASLYSRNNINPAVKIWNGNVDNYWNTSTPNWVYNSVSTNISSGESALFDDTASTNNVNLTALLIPWSVTVSNNALAYTFGGSGSLDTTSYGSANGLTKDGAGALTLANSGTNKFSLIAVADGTCLVGNGSTLAVGAGGSITNGALLIVSNATFDVSSAGSIAGSGSMEILGGTMNLGQVQAGVGSLAITNGTLSFKANQNNTNIIIAGSFATGGTTNLVNVTSVPASASYPIEFPIIEYGSAATGLVDVNNKLTTLGVSLPSLGGSAGYLTNNAANSSIDLVLTSGPEAVVPITWVGQTNGVDVDSWDILVTSNWVNGSSQPYYYQNGSDVTFDDSSLGTGNVNLTTTLSPASVSFNNFSTSYTLAGSGKLSGSASFTISGGGLVVLDNSGTNDFSGAVNINSGTLQVGNNDANGNLPGNVNNGAGLVFNRSDNALNMSGVISGSGSVTNDGSGTVTLNGVQAYTGATVVNAGILAVQAPNQGNSGIGSSSGLTVNNGGTFQVNSDNALSGTATALPVTVNAGGTLTGLATANNGVGTSSHIHGLLTLSGGTLAMGGTQDQPRYGTWDLDAGVTVNGGIITSTITASNVIPSQTLGAIFTVYGGGTPSGIDLLVSGTLINGTSQHDTGIALVGVTGGVMALDNNNTYAAGTTITSGTLQAGTEGDTAPLTTPLGTGGVDIYGGAFLKLASSQGVTINNIITDSGTLMAVSGTNILTGTDTFSGNTVVTGGKLVLSGEGAINSSASISVSNAILDVSGMSSTFDNPNSMSLDSGSLNLGNNQVTSLYNLSLTNSTVTLAVRPDTTSITLASTLATAGTTNVMNITSLPGFTYPTNITLIKYSFADANLVDVNNKLTSLGVSLPSYGNPSGYLTNNTANNSIDLVLVSGAPPVLPVTWTGETNAVNLADWDILNNTNWVTTADGVTPYFYQDGSAVTFDDSVAGTTSVNLTTALSPGSLTVSNATKSYTFSGNGKISGSGALIKTNSGAVTFSETGGDDFTGGITMGGGTVTYAVTGAATAGGVTNSGGTLVLDQTGTFAGNTTISAGTVQVGNNDTNGVLPSGTIANNASLVFKRTDSFATANAISGTGAVTHDGTGTNLISGVNSYSGATAINAGRVVMGSDSAFGTPSATVAGGDAAVVSGATLDLSGITGGGSPGVGIKNYNIAGTGVGGIGAVVNYSTNVNAFLHGFNNVTLTANATIGGNDDAPSDGTTGNSGHGRIDIGRDVAGSKLTLNGFTLTKIGSNMVNFAANLTTTPGNIVWNGGVLSMDSGATLFTNTDAGSYIIMDTNTVLENFHTPAGSVLTPIIFNGSGITVGETAGTSTGTIDSSIAANSNVSFVERNGITTGTVLLNGPVSDVSGSLSSTLAGNPSLPSVAVGTGSITVKGTRLMLAGTNTYTGPTIVTNGTLYLTNNGSIVTTPTITVASGATMDVAGRVDQSLTLGANQTLVDNGTVNCGAGQSVTASSGSTLFGNGTVTGNLYVNAGSVMSPGAGIDSVGILTVSGTASLGGTNYLTIDKSLSPSNDVLVANTILLGGTLTITNVGPALVAGDSFTFLSSGLIASAFGETNLPTLGGSLVWTNNAPGTWSVVSTSSVNMNPTNITTTVSGNQIILSWPADHTGWYLQAQTNALNAGLGTNWVTIPNSNLSDSYTNTVDPTKGTVFYRMVSP